MIESKIVEVKDPPFAKELFSYTGAWSSIWFLVRIYLGWLWLEAGWEKVMGTGAHPWGEASLVAFWQRAVSVPAAPARPLIAYDWYRTFLQYLLNIHAEKWMAPLVAWGELLVGVALLAGFMVGIIAFVGAFMNMNFMLAGTASINPVMLILAIFLMLAWKTAGWYGFDRWVLPKLGTPWAPIFINKKS